MHRAELTVLERDEQIVEWIRLTEEADKLSQIATVSEKPKGGRGKSAGVRKAAKELGIDKDDAHRAVKVASLTEEAKETAREVAMANQGRRG
jgi:ParB family chromosome partitioning protein